MDLILGYLEFRTAFFGLTVLLETIFGKVFQKLFLLNKKWLQRLMEKQPDVYLGPNCVAFKIIHLKIVF